MSIEPGTPLRSKSGLRASFVRLTHDDRIVIRARGRLEEVDPEDWDLADGCEGCHTQAADYFVGFCGLCWAAIPVELRADLWDDETGEAMGRARMALKKGPPVEPNAQLAKQYRSEAEELRAALEGFVITSADDLALAVDTVKEAKTRLKAIEAEEKKITKPMREALDATRALFRPAREAYAGIEQSMKLAIANRAAVEVTANAAAIERVAAGDALALAQTTSVASAEGISIRHTQAFEVVDPDAVPRELCSPDADKIAAALTLGIEVPGVRVFDKAIVAVRAGK